MAKKVFFINSTLANYTDEEFSWFQKYALNAGVIGDSAGTLGLAVSANSPAGMSVLVGAGSAIVELTKSGVTWKTILVSSAIDTIVIAPNSSGSNRVDAIIARIDKDAEPDALKSNIGTIEVVLGSGASALSDGAIATAIGNDGFIRLANVTVSNGASSIVAGNIADTKSQVVYNSALLPNPKKIQFSIVASDPTTLVEGMVWFNSTSHTLNFYDGSTVKTLGVSAVGYNPLSAQAQGTPDLTLQVSAGNVKFNAGICKYAGGNSPAFTAPVTVNQKRIDLLCINSAGTLSIVQGTATTGTPSAPTYPIDKFVICEVYMRYGATSIVSSDDSVNGYIYKDVRYFCSAENPNQKTMTAGESISGGSLPVPVMLPSSVLDSQVIYAPYGQRGSNIYTLTTASTYRMSQSFNSGDYNYLTYFCVNMYYWSGSGNISWELYLADGSLKKTGSVIASGTTARGSSTSENTLSLITPSSPISVSKNTNYVLVIYANVNGVRVGFDGALNNTGNYYAYYSTDSGSTWTTNTYQLYFRVYGYDNESFTAGRIYASKTGKINRRDFIGFAVSTSTTGNDIVIQTDGVVSGFSGLTAGAFYYVQDSGGIGTTKGVSSEILVGKAISATQLLIMKDRNGVIASEPFVFVGSELTSAKAYLPPLPSIAKKAIIVNGNWGSQMLDFETYISGIYGTTQYALAGDAGANLSTYHNAGVYFSIQTNTNSLLYPRVYFYR